MSDWQPLSTAPRDGTRVLLWLRSGDCAIANSKLGSKPSNWPSGWDWPSEATHWMPLPLPPEKN